MATTTKAKVKLSVMWGKTQLIAPSFYSFDVSWLRDTTVRQLLMHVTHEADVSRSLDDAEAIAVYVVEHIDEVTASGGKRKRPSGRSNATRLLDDYIYETMQDLPTREFHFEVQLAVQQERHVVDALQVLRSAQSRSNPVLPATRRTTDNTADDILHNDILVWLEKQGVGWSRDELHITGRDFVNRLTTAFFPLTTDMFDAMSDGHNAVKPFPAAELHQFFGRKKQGTKGKKVQERLETSMLGFDAAFTNTKAPWRKSGRWPAVVKMLQDLSKSVTHYNNRLYGQATRQPAIHQATQPVRTASNAVDFTTVEKSSLQLKVANDMSLLDNKLNTTDEYVPIEVNDYMAELDTMGRYRFINNVRSGLTTPFQLWSWMKGGGSAGVSTHFLWKIPPLSDKKRRAEMDTKAARIVGELTTRQEMHYGRAVMTAYLGVVVQSDFISSKAGAKAVWQFITGSNVTASNEGTAIAALWALNSRDEDTVMDMRAMNGRTKDPAFDAFWEELLQQLESYKTVHSRRHGSDRNFMPFAVSIRAMIDKVKKALEIKHAPASLESLGIKIPSAGYVGMQFAPKDKRTSAALAYTGMLGLVHMVQQRTLHAHHVDSHYCAKNYKNLREYGVMMKQTISDAGSDAGVVFVSSDDKAKIPVGEPHLPIIIAARGKATICPQSVIDDGLSKAGDHDFHCVNLTPSVNLTVDVKTPSASADIGKVLQSYYKGTPHVTVKDSVFQASSPLRHTAELLPILMEQYATAELAAILMFTDGGPDHNCKHLSVQTTLLALFLLSGVDTMVVLRTAPQQSWTNPAERIMSILNLGLQGCSLARTLMDHMFEVTMRKCNGMNAIRRAAAASKAAAQAAPDPAHVHVSSAQTATPAAEEAPTPAPSAHIATPAVEEAPPMAPSAEAAAPIAKEPQQPAHVNTDQSDPSSALGLSDSDDAYQPSQEGSVISLDDESVDDETSEQPPAAAAEQPPASAEQPPIGVGADTVPNAQLADVPVYKGGNFQDVYAASIARPVSIVEGQFRQLQWSDNPLGVHPAATEKECETVLEKLQEIEKDLKDLRITRKEAPDTCPALMKVLENHTRSSDYMIQFFKLPISSPCDCKACELLLFEPLRMPLPAYQELQAKPFPLPIPQAKPDASGNFCYMSLKDTMELPFTDEHQPSKLAKSRAGAVAAIATRGRGRGRGRRGNRRGRSRATEPSAADPPGAEPVRVQLVSSTVQKMTKRTDFKLGHTDRLRGLVHCKDCQRPRCIYSQQAVARMKPSGEHTPEEATDCRLIAEQAMEDAVESEIYICGMQPLDEGSPCHGIFLCDPELACDTPIECDFYSTRRPVVAPRGYTRDLSICAICAGTSHDAEGGKIDQVLQSVYSTVLPICTTCKSQGAKTVVGRYARNGAELLKRLDQEKRVVAARATTSSQQS